MPYTSMGYRTVTATPDQTGQNPGNYTAVFNSSVIGSNLTSFQVYHIYLMSPSVTTGFTSATVMLNRGLWDVTLIAQGNGWDPSQPLLMSTGDELDILFNVPTTETPAPVVTIWLRTEQ